MTLIYEDYINESKLNFRPGVLRLIEELKKNNIRIALVSSSSEMNVNNLLNKGLKIKPKNYFDIIAHGDCTKNKKPSPEIYEWTLEKLKLSSQSCIAIEDSPRGLESALAANIKVVITPSDLTLDEKFEGAELVVSSLGEPSQPSKMIEGKFDFNEFIDLKLLKKIINA